MARSRSSPKKQVFFGAFLISLTLAVGPSTMTSTYFSERPLCDIKTLVDNGCFVQVFTRSAIHCFALCVQTQVCTGVMRATSTQSCYHRIGCSSGNCMTFDTEYRYYEKSVMETLQEITAVSVYTTADSMETTTEETTTEKTTTKETTTEETTTEQTTTEETTTEKTTTEETTTEKTTTEETTTEQTKTEETTTEKTATEETTTEQTTTALIPPQTSPTTASVMGCTVGNTMLTNYHEPNIIPCSIVDMEECRELYDSNTKDSVCDAAHDWRLCLENLNKNTCTVTVPHDLPFVEQVYGCTCP